jgi:hypothetical protein
MNVSLPIDFCPINRLRVNVFFFHTTQPTSNLSIMKPVIMDFNGRLFTFPLRTPFPRRFTLFLRVFFASKNAFFSGPEIWPIEIYQFHKRIEWFPTNVSIPPMDVARERRPDGLSGKEIA